MILEEKEVHDALQSHEWVHLFYDSKIDVWNVSYAPWSCPVRICKLCLKTQTFSSGWKDVDPNMHNGTQAYMEWEFDVLNALNMFLEEESSESEIIQVTSTRR